MFHRRLLEYLHQSGQCISSTSQPVASAQVRVSWKGPNPESLHSVDIAEAEMRTTGAAVAVRAGLSAPFAAFDLAWPRPTTGHSQAASSLPQSFPAFPGLGPVSCCCGTSVWWTVCAMSSSLDRHRLSPTIEGRTDVLHDPYTVRQRLHMKACYVLIHRNRTTSCKPTDRLKMTQLTYNNHSLHYLGQQFGCQIFDPSGAACHNAWHQMTLLRFI